MIPFGFRGKSGLVKQMFCVPNVGNLKSGHGINTSRTPPPKGVASAIEGITRATKPMRNGPQDAAR